MKATSFAGRLLCVLLSLSMLIGTTGIAAEGHKKKTSVKQLKSQRASVRGKRKKLQAKLHKIKGQVHNARLSIQELDSRIGSVQDQLNQTTDRLAQEKKEQKILAKQLKAATEKFESRSEQARQRLREIYEHGEVSLASAFVGSKNMGDIASRKFIFQQIAQRDRELFEEVRQLRNEVQHEKVKTDQLVGDIRDLMARESEQKANLQDARQEKAQYLEGLKGQQAQLETLVAELDKEENDLTASIAAYDAGPGRVTNLHFNGRFMVPVNGARFSSGFGMRFHPILHRTRMHTGQDLAAPHGTPIHAAADGIVITTRSMRGYGNAVVVDHGGGISTLYGHCSAILCSPGQRVRKGEVIARVGSTGLATGPHCHFEVRINGRPVNPLPYLRGR